jgi:hypothetical protein
MFVPFPSFLLGHSFFLWLGLLQPKQTMALAVVAEELARAFFWEPGLEGCLGLGFPLRWLEAAKGFGFREAKWAFSQ